MNKLTLLNRMFKERNSSESTRITYWRSVNFFEDLTGKGIIEMLEIAETEEENNIRWKNCHLRKWLIKYREWCYKKYKIRTAKLYVTAIITLFRHYEVTVEHLPYYSTTNAQPSIPINPDLMVDRDILKLCIDTSNPLLRALTLLMSSSGLSRVDTLNLKVKDWLKATGYNRLKDIPDDLVPTWELRRQKTSKHYYTFNSPEATNSINAYLRTRKELTPESPLFEVDHRYFNELFKIRNDELGLGKNGQYSRFAPHMLRRYQATQLIEAGMSVDKVDLIQGRKPKGIAYNSYIKIRPSKLREEYIQCLPYIVIEDYQKVKTELDIVKEENKTLKEKNEDLEDLKKRVLALESDRPTWNEIKNK